MDPDAAFDLMLAAFDDEEFSIASDAAQSLINWIRAGGFPPTVHVMGGGQLLKLSHEQSNRAIAFAVANEILIKANSALRAR